MQIRSRDSVRPEYAGKLSTKNGNSLYQQQVNFNGTRHVQREKTNILCLEIVECFVICENKECFVLVPSPPIKSIDVFVALLSVISKLPSVEMIYVTLFTV